MTLKNLLGAALIVIAAGLAAGGFFAAKSIGQAKYDPETLCPVEGARSVTLIIVDKTDPLTPIEQVRAREIMTAERDAAKRGDRIVVKLLTAGGAPSSVALDTVLDLCNPGAEANPFFENPKRIAARYKSAFLEPVAEALATFSGEGSASASPIVRAVQLGMEGLHAAPETHVRLILVSDLMEHGPDVSAYAGGLTEKALQKLLSPGADDRLRGADVRIVLLSRPRYETQQKDAVIAWRKFFAGMAGREPDIVRP